MNASETNRFATQVNICKIQGLEVLLLTVLERINWKTNPSQLPTSEIPSERPTAEALQDSECPNCKEHRRNWNKDKKFILQSKRDKEALQKRIVEPEAELKRYKYETPPDQENEEVCCFPKVSLLPFSSRGLSLFFFISCACCHCTLECVL